MAEYNNKIAEIGKKGKPVVDTLIDMLEEAGKYDVLKNADKYKSDDDIKYELLWDEIIVIKNRLNAIEARFERAKKVLNEEIYLAKDGCMVKKGAR